MCHKVLRELGITDNPLFDLAAELEEIALQDEYFVARKLYPNVDFYSGIILQRDRLPRSMFTVMFAVARTVGWVAHWQEMISRSGAADRPPEADLYRLAAAGLRADRPPLTSTSRYPVRKGSLGLPFFRLRRVVSRSLRSTNTHGAATQFHTAK